MIPTNLIHNTKNNPTIYKVYFLENVKKEIERILTLNLCNMSIRPYNRWLQYFYATTKWIRETNQWFSLLTYGYIDGSISIGNQYQHVDALGSLTYQRIKDINGQIIIVVTNVHFNPYTFNRTRILMEFVHKRVDTINISEIQLRNIIKESIKKVLNII